MKLSTRSRGQIAQLKVELECSKRNYIISRPSIDCYYDILIDIKNTIIRSQIKYCNRKRSENGLSLRLDGKGSKRIFYTKTMIDWILVFVPTKDVILKYEKKHFHRKKTIYINLTNKKSEYYYEKFLW